MTRYMNLDLLVLAAVVGFAFAGWTNGLLAILCALLLVAVLDVQAMRASLKTIADVFNTEPDAMTEEHADQMVESTLDRVRADMLQQMRRPN